MVLCSVVFVLFLSVCGGSDTIRRQAWSHGKVSLLSFYWNVEFPLSSSRDLEAAHKFVTMCMQIEVEATKEEVEYMVELFKSELESASRIVAGGLKLLQLHGTIGQSAIDQLSHFGKLSVDPLLSDY